MLNLGTHWLKGYEQSLSGREKMSSITIQPFEKPTPSKLSEKPSGESDPNGKDAHEPGSKLDSGKPSVYQFVLSYFPNAILAVAGVSAYGAKKYTPMGWRTVPDGISRYTEAMLRHVVDEAKGEDIDVSGLKHAAQVAWNALARLELMLTKDR